MIEPSKDNFRKLVYSRSSKNYFSNSACVSFNFKKSTIEMFYSNLMTIASEGESDIIDRKNHALQGEKFFGGKTYTMYSTTATLDSILTLAKAPKNIDFLSLDVEGLEIEVLKGLDHKKYRFSYILVETRDIEKMQVYLSDLDYELIRNIIGHDFLFKNVQVN